MPPADGEGIRVQLATRLRLLREKAGLTQGEMAAACGLSKVFYGTLERAEKSAGVETLAKLARGLGVEPTDLFNFGAKSTRSEATAADKLGRKVASLARDASPGKLARFEVIARAFFEPDDRAPPRQRRAR